MKTKLNQIDELATVQTQPKKRGFAVMDKEEQRLIASAGGRAAHMKGTAHQFTSEEAREAGKKGGAMRKANFAGRKVVKA